MTMSALPQVVVAADPDALSKAAAERVLARIAANSGRIAICLTGGSGPKKLYELLSAVEIDTKEEGREEDGGSG